MLSSLRRATAVALIALVGLVAAPIAPVQAATPANDYARAAFKATNAQRVARDIAPLAAGACLRKFAVRQARKMATQERMFHQDLGAIMEACGLSGAAENVAYGYRSGRAIVNQGWIHSEGHRANILNPAFTRMGIGARKGEDGNWYVAQVFGTPA